ncbi:hypothetical protein C5167_030086 [Papaver somniferum]|nr:hypothetical protein C5167_030086 [Papaver somniferum]
MLLSFFMQDIMEVYPIEGRCFSHLKSGQHKCEPDGGANVIGACERLCDESGHIIEKNRTTKSQILVMDSKFTVTEAL